MAVWPINFKSPFVLRAFSSSGPSHSRLGRALWARNEGLVPSVLYDGCGVFLVGDVKALGG
jgi:hypothetical protein